MNGSNSLVQERTRDCSVSTNIANVYHTINYKFLPLMCFAVMWINVFKMSSCYWVQLVHTCENWGCEFNLIIHINRHLYGGRAEGRALSKNIWLAFTMLWVPFPGTQINKILKWFGDIKRIVTFKKEHGLSGLSCHLRPYCCSVHCLWGPCLGLWSYFGWGPCSWSVPETIRKPIIPAPADYKEQGSYWTLIQMTADTQVRKRDMGDFWDYPYPP